MGTFLSFYILKRLNIPFRYKPRKPDIMIWQVRHCNTIICIDHIEKGGPVFAENDKTANHIRELEEKVARQGQAISGYLDQLRKLTDHKSERDLYSELAVVFAQETSVDEVFKKTLEALPLHLKAKYVGVFLLDTKNDRLEYRHGKGYNTALFPVLPYVGSCMGQSLFRREIIWESAFQKRTNVVQLNQDPPENNVLCVPVILLGNEAGVIRCANIEAATIDKTKAMMRTITQLLCSSLERLMLQSKNEWTLRSLDISYSISRLLEDTLDKQEITKRVCSEVPRLFPCAGCVCALADPSGDMNTAARWPESFELAGNGVSGAIYMRNLLTAFPDGNACIPNIHSDDRRWSWSNPKVKSLCMAPLRLRNEVRGVLIAVGPIDATYEHAHENLLGIVASQASVTLERASYFLQQEDRARTDALTGLFNRRMFQEMLSDEINRVKRYGRPLSLVMIDIDHFKKCNDTYGHPVGDEVIRMVSRTIKSMIRTTDRAFRYGGEEFAILLPETSSGNGYTLSERLRITIEADRSVKGPSITISSGITEFAATDTPESFVKRADTCLYSAKESGRNRVVIS
jgi:diguanylate cyclase (GGDEF)-like protein